MRKQGSPARRRWAAVLAVLSALVVVFAVWGLNRPGTAPPPAAEPAAPAPTATGPVLMPTLGPTALAVSTPGAQVVAQLDTRDLPDGPAPTHWDTGQPAMSSYAAADPSSDFEIRNGRLTNNPSTDGRSVAYFSTPDLGGPITELGARFVFEPRNGSSGLVTLIVSQELKAAIPQIVGPVSIHCLIGADGWNLTLGPDDKTPLEVIAEGKFDPPLKQDNTTVHEASIKINGGRATLNLPDGSQQIVNDRRIADWRGPFATFELYSQQGRTDSIPGFEKLWAIATPAPGRQ